MSAARKSSPAELTNCSRLRRHLRKSALLSDSLNVGKNDSLEIKALQVSFNDALATASASAAASAISQGWCCSGCVQRVVPQRYNVGPDAPGLPVAHAPLPSLDYTASGRSRDHCCDTYTHMSIQHVGAWSVIITRQSPLPNRNNTKPSMYRPDTGIRQASTDAHLLNPSPNRARAVPVSSRESKYTAQSHHALIDPKPVAV